MRDINSRFRERSELQERLDQVSFQMDAARFRRFVKLLDTPPAPNPGFERLMAVKPPWLRKAEGKHPGSGAPHAPR
jgi:Protein of unknown function (DUF1778)